MASDISATVQEWFPNIGRSHTDNDGFPIALGVKRPIDHINVELITDIRGAPRQEQQADGDGGFDHS